MSRGFDGFEIDDFRGSDSNSGRDVSRDASSDWNTQNILHHIWREEDQSDRLDRESRARSDRERPSLVREERVHAILSQRVRTKYTDRNKDYSLRDFEIHTSWHSFRHGNAILLGEVGESIKTAQAILGHSDIETTLNTYVHAIPDSQRRAVERVAGVLFPDVHKLASGPNEPRKVN